MKLFRIVLSLCTVLPWSGPPANAQVTLNPNPSRVLGQKSMRSYAPNLVEGRELWLPQGLALDTNATPPILYVSDTLNNRVLAWRDATKAAAGSTADLVIGQRDMISTSALGPGSSFRSGLTQPTGIAVDSQGNVYVVDTGNNRILRFPQPFAHTSDAQTAEMVIGQPNLNPDSDKANQGLQVPNNQTISLSSGSSTYRAALAFDSRGNLYFTDAGNNRVLRYPAAQLAGSASMPAADLVLGQGDFVSNRGPNADGIQASDYTNASAMLSPGGLGISSSWLFVSDDLSRVLVYPLQGVGIGAPATRIMGLPPAQPTSGTLPKVNQYTFNSPNGVVMIGTYPGVIDSGDNRIAIFAPVEQWPAATPNALSPAATSVIGQPDLNTGLAKADSAGLSAPVQAILANNELYVADAGNNRVVVFPQPLGTGSAASRVVGQLGFGYNSPNLIEGKELYIADPRGTVGGGIALDYTASPPHLYIADTFNNRILAYRDARRAQTGATADLVIGQADLLHSVANYPSNDPTIVSAAGLAQPSGVLVDGDGNLLVADTGNGRILRFARPFDQQGPPRPNLVLGQPNLTTKPTGEPTRSKMASPYGLALTPEGHLLASDATQNRVLLFKRPTGGDFTNGMDATAVFGQQDFTSASSITGDPNLMKNPRGIAVDTSARLYVADTGNNRVMIYAGVSNVTGGGTSPALRLTGFNKPAGVFVDPADGNIWVADVQNNKVWHYPEYGSLPVNNYQPLGSISDGGPLAVVLDAGGNLLASDAANRIALYFPLMVGSNAASSLADTAVGLAPGTWTTLKPYAPQGGTGNPLGGAQPIAEAIYSSMPVPTTLGDVQLALNSSDGTLNNVLAPLSYVGPTQINFLMPMNAPASGTVDVVATKVSTGQVLASGTIRMQSVSPALFTTSMTGSGQVAALNQDNTVNSPGNAAARGDVIQLFGTGAGFIPGAPSDGSAPTTSLPTPGSKPRVWIEPDYVPDANVEFSGLSTCCAGLWQINVRIPTEKVAPGQRQIFVLWQDVPSRRPGIQTVISVK